MDLINYEPIDALLAPRVFSYTDDDLDIHGVSETAGRSIKQIVFTFTNHHNLPYGDWRIKAYGLPGSDSIDVWITAPGGRPRKFAMRDADAKETLGAILDELSSRQ